MAGSSTHQTDVVIAGGGLAGIVTAYELLGTGRRVTLIDKDRRERFGGLARESSGGMFFVGTPQQRRLGFVDSSDLAWSDWQRVADYGEGETWPRRWGAFFCEHSFEHVFEFVHARRIAFLPMVLWAERGLQAPGNSVPRWHMAWGLGQEVVQRLIASLETHPRRDRLELLFDTEVQNLEVTAGGVTGVRARRVDGTSDLEVTAPHVVIASGGISGGDLAKLRANWHQPWGPPPERLLNGGHAFGDGQLHDRVCAAGGAVTNLDRQWLYATGVHHPERRRPDDGQSLVLPRSALWLDARGVRIMSPCPLPAHGDTRHGVATVLGLPGQYSWQVLNWTIAMREISASGTRYLTAIREKSWLGLAATLVFGNRADNKRLIRDCAEDIVIADSVDELAAGMNRLSLDGLEVDAERMASTLNSWDEMIDRGRFHDDDQLRWIETLRAYRGDRVRTCKFQKILDPKARPLIAIRQFVITRKSLGGIQTDLQCRVLRASDGEPVPGLYAVGEAAGFGGGGAHGKGSLEGTFLTGCILTGRAAGRGIDRSAPLTGGGGNR
jgi:predicted oxidoreductase